MYPEVSVETGWNSRWRLGTQGQDGSDSVSNFDSLTWYLDQYVSSILSQKSLCLYESGLIMALKNETVLNSGQVTSR